jgi:GNAT superfamily N-acetyltransferase
MERVYRDYLDDLAPLNTGIFPILGEVGHREPDQIARWFGDPNALPLVIAKASEPEPVGFAMVVRHAPGTEAPGSRISGSSKSWSSVPGTGYRMAEFFVTRPNRGRGIGRGAVQLILDRFAGRWEIIEYVRNPGAVRFWRRVVSGYTRGHYQERVINGEVHQVFESGRAPR